MTVEPATHAEPVPAGGTSEAAATGSPFLDDHDVAGADLQGKVREAWQDFARTLAATLPRLAAGTTLDLVLDPTAAGTGEAVYGVRISVAEAGLTGLAVSNAALPQGYRLDRAAIGELVALGWSPPGVLDGSGESFGLRLGADEANRLAVVVARTMRDVYGAPHPAFLTYAAHDGEAASVAVPALGAARLAAADGGPEGGDDPQDATTNRMLDRLDDHAAELPLGERVHTVVAALLKTEPEALAVDPEGDIGIRSGTAMVFVRVRDNPPLIDVFSPLLTEVEATERLYAKLSELTNRMPIGRLYCTKDTVWASVPVFGRDFQPSHLMLAIQVMTGLADELDDRLQGEFGGKRFFGEGDQPAVKGGEHTGMYL